MSPRRKNNKTAGGGGGGAANKSTASSSSSNLNVSVDMNKSTTEKVSPRRSTRVVKAKRQYSPSPPSPRLNMSKFMKSGKNTKTNVTTQQVHTEPVEESEISTQEEHNVETSVVSQGHNSSINPFEMESQDILDQMDIGIPNPIEEGPNFSDEPTYRPMTPIVELHESPMSFKRAGRSEPRSGKKRKRDIDDETVDSVAESGKAIEGEIANSSILVESPKGKTDATIDPRILFPEPPLLMDSHQDESDPVPEQRTFSEGESLLEAGCSKFWHQLSTSIYPSPATQAETVPTNKQLDPAEQARQFEEIYGTDVIFYENGDVWETTLAPPIIKPPNRGILKMPSPSGSGSTSNSSNSSDEKTLPKKKRVTIIVEPIHTRHYFCQKLYNRTQSGKERKPYPLPSSQDKAIKRRPRWTPEELQEKNRNWYKFYDPAMAAELYGSVSEGAGQNPGNVTLTPWRAPIATTTREDSINRSLSQSPSLLPPGTSERTRLIVEMAQKGRNPDQENRDIQVIGLEINLDSIRLLNQLVEYLKKTTPESERALMLLFVDHGLEQKILELMVQSPYFSENLVNSSKGDKEGQFSIMEDLMSSETRTSFETIYGLPFLEVIPTEFWKDVLELTRLSFLEVTQGDQGCGTLCNAKKVKVYERVVEVLLQTYPKSFSQFRLNGLGFHGFCKAFFEDIRHGDEPQFYSLSQEKLLNHTANLVMGLDKESKRKLLADHFFFK